MFANRRRGGADATETNFQRASCTLDASVMIYASRVDSVHKDTFKVLGSFSSSNKEEAHDGDGEGAKKKFKKRKTQTLETNLNNINAKTVDQSYYPDPMFQKMSHAFDKGGAAGLLFNSLTIYRGCNIAFDSEVVP